MTGQMNTGSTLLNETTASNNTQIPHRTAHCQTLITNHLKKQCHQRHRLGTANQNTIYFSATTKMNSRLSNAQASRKFMTMHANNSTERERTNVIKLLNGNQPVHQQASKEVYMRLPAFR
jgi:hypothetical protein